MADNAIDDDLEQESHDSDSRLLTKKLKSHGLTSRDEATAAAHSSVSQARPIKQWPKAFTPVPRILQSHPGVEQPERDRQPAVSVYQDDGQEKYRHADLERHIAVTRNRAADAIDPTIGIDIKTDRYICLYPESAGSCSKTGEPIPGPDFARRVDLERHIAVTHNRSGLQLFDCPHPGCHRIGREGFTRKDKVVDHLRDVHKQPAKTFARDFGIQKRDHSAPRHNDRPARLLPSIEPDFMLPSDYSHPVPESTAAKSTGESLTRHEGCPSIGSVDSLRHDCSNAEFPPGDVSYNKAFAKAAAGEGVLGKEDLPWNAIERMPRLQSSSQSVHDSELQMLLQGDRYYAELETLEVEVAKRCKLDTILACNDGTLDETARGEVTVSITKLLKRSGNNTWLHCMDLLDGVLDAIALLKAAGMCADAVDFFVDEAVRPGVINTAELPVDLLRIVRTHLVMIVDAVEAQQRTEGVSSHLNRVPRPISRWLNLGIQMATDDLDPKVALALCCVLFALITVSYTGSHCSATLGTMPVHSFYIKLPGQNTGTSPNICFRQQRLACLDSFVGGPVWVFSVFHSRPVGVDRMLAISMHQFARIWGPLYSIPHSKAEGTLLALRTDDGVIHRVPQDEPGVSLAENETLMHWAETGPDIRRLRAGNGSIEERISWNQSIELIPFPENSRLLIGQPTEVLNRRQAASDNVALGRDVHLLSGRSNNNHGQTTFHTARAQAADAGALSTTAHALPVAATNTGTNYTSPTVDHTESVVSAPAGLHHRSECSVDLDDFREMYHFRMRAVGTHKAFFAPDEYQVNFTAGQYVSAGISQVRKRRPATKRKTILLSLFTRRAAGVRSMLDLKVGIEYSLCTGNARQVSLWEALKIAFPTHLDTLRKAYADEDGEILSSYLVEMEKTGQEHDGGLALFWPYSRGLLETLHLTDKLPAWTSLLKDTHVSACFAVASGRCLAYSAPEQAKGCNKICNPCSKIGGISRISTQASAMRQAPVLETVFDLSRSSPALPLSASARIEIDQGTLEVQSMVALRQLLFFRPAGFLDRMRALRTCCLDGHRRCIHGVVSDDPHPSKFAVAAYVVDCQGKGIPETM